MSKEAQVNKSEYDIKQCIKRLEKLERECRVNNELRRAAIIRKAVSHLKMAQRAS